MSDIRDPYEAERLDVVAPDELHTRRDFLQRTAVTAGLAASLGLTLHPDTVIAAAARQQRRAAIPSPRNLPIDTFVVLDDGKPLVRPLPRLAAGRRRAAGRPAVHRRPRTRVLNPPAGQQLPGLRVPGPRPLMGRRADGDGRRQDGRLPARPERRVLDRLLRRAGPSVHAARSEGVHGLRPLLLLAAVVHVPQPRVHACGPVLRDDGQHGADLTERPARLPRHDDLPRAVGQGRLQPLLLLRHPGLGAVGRARDLALEPGPDLLRAGRDRHAAGAVVRRPGVQRRGPGHVGRRAPARRCPGRPGIRRRRRPRVPGVAAVQARRAVHRLRRVGRLLRPRPAAPRPRPARQLGHQQGLRPDGPANPGGGGVTVRATRLRRPFDLRV